MKQMGSPIQVDGVRPRWLRDDVEIQRRDKAGLVDGWHNGCIVTAGALTWGDWVTHIRLPEDHFAYIAIAAGFEPWASSDAAPDDWDGGDVLYGDGVVGGGPYLWSYDLTRGLTVIGYKKRVDAEAEPTLWEDPKPTTQPDTDPTVALLTEIRDLLKPKVVTVDYGVNAVDTVSFGPSEYAPAPNGYIAAGPWVVPDDGRTPDFPVGSFYQMASEDGLTINDSAHEMRRRNSSSRTAYRLLNQPEPLTITITGPQGSGKTRWAEVIRNLPAALLGFPVPVVVDGEVG